eukprot:2295763-Prymnesium_polylepis.1
MMLLHSLCHGFAAQPAAERPCDIFEAGGTPCVAAHSTVRAMFAGYAGALYQVKRLPDGATMDIKALGAGGFADASGQDRFCGASSCVIQRIYDQSPRSNHLDIAPPGGAHPLKDAPCNATKDPLSVGGSRVYSAYFEGGMGYRRDNTSGIAVGDAAETMYMVTSGSHYNDRCCFDYGNAEVNNLDDGARTMEAVYFGNAKGGLNHGGAGKGPWIMADMENALWGADRVVSNEPPIEHAFVTAMVKGDESTRNATAGPYQPGVDFAGSDMEPCGRSGCTLEPAATHGACERLCNQTVGCVGYVFAEAACSGATGPICWTKSAMSSSGSPASCRASRVLGNYPGHWAIKGGDAQAGGLTVYWDGKRAPRYAPMKKQGALILGIGGDNSDGAVGTFYEGAMVAGYTSDATDDAVQANVVAAGYGRK